MKKVETIAKDFYRKDKDSQYTYIYSFFIVNNNFLMDYSVGEGLPSVENGRIGNLLAKTEHTSNGYL